MSKPNASRQDEKELSAGVQVWHTYGPVLNIGNVSGELDWIKEGVKKVVISNLDVSEQDRKFSTGSCSSWVNI